ncbi:hypothetical protein HK103_000597 [Boothiomyces macroporosus]|uniref:Uncharacterized protein n=1 Tax=Boothiomyces macroporosus TaxID=261099 RepID=A0AAD5UK94_9FUNG|nr:hypothetical protein HK103_000597 [Boothiomyces macroporosus]
MKPASKFFIGSFITYFIFRKKIKNCLPYIKVFLVLAIMMCSYFIFFTAETDQVVIPHSDNPYTVKPLAILNSMKATCQSLKSFSVDTTDYLQTRLRSECELEFSNEFESYVTEFVPFDQVIINYEPETITSSVYLMNFAKNIRTVSSDSQLCDAIEYIRVKAGLGNFKCVRTNSFYSQNLFVFSQLKTFDKSRIENLRNLIRGDGKALVQFLQTESVDNIRQIKGLDILPITDPKKGTLLGVIVTKSK